MKPSPCMFCLVDSPSWKTTKLGLVKNHEVQWRCPICRLGIFDKMLLQGGPRNDLAISKKWLSHLQEVEALRRKQRGTSRRPTPSFLSLSPFLFFSLWLSGVAKLDSRPALVIPKPSSLQNHQFYKNSMKSSHQGGSYKEAWRWSLEDQLHLSLSLLSALPILSFTLDIDQLLSVYD